MATYKVIQDVEADDKLVGPLSVRQFIYASIAGLCGWLSFMAVAKGLAVLMIVLVPIMLFTAFFALPWGGEQPTELWALAKIRFMLKPHKRIWDQSGTKDLVTITVPKKVERMLTDGLSQSEVRSRLAALADTIDSRGWAIKNANVNLASGSVGGGMQPSDRLVVAAQMPQQVIDVDVRPSDDVLDTVANQTAHNLDAMIHSAAQEHREQLMQQIQQPAPPPADPAAAAVSDNSAAPQDAGQSQPQYYWFTNQPATGAPAGAADNAADAGTPAVTNSSLMPQASNPTAEEQALADQIKAANDQGSMVYNNLKTIKTPAQVADEARQAAAQKAQAAVTPERQAAIMNLARNDDLNVATLARQANQPNGGMQDGEVVIPLR